MQRQIASSAGTARRPVGLRRRPLTAAQESIFLAVIFALGLGLQLAVVLLQASASG